MRRKISVDSAIAWLLAVVGSGVYLLTMDRTVSWWDCGEFITTGYYLEVGHPPGAPFYQLLSHIFMFLAAGDVQRVALLSNTLSALAGGMTLPFMYLSLRMLIGEHKGVRIASMVATLCYLFCHTAWFSAVESEVYALAMLLCSMMIWTMLRWERDREGRWLVLTGLILGLGVGTHFLTLLTTPMLFIIFLRNKGFVGRASLRSFLLAALMFVVGASVYAIIPIRASAKPPINEGNPSDFQRFVSYVGRDQYQKAPLFPRQWKQGDEDNYAYWTGGKKGFIGEVKYYLSYQLNYMYLRYIIDNFGGRTNDKWHVKFFFVLPLLFALLGFAVLWRRNRRQFWLLLTLFFVSGPLLNLYLNHPCYEPRERDYAYVLSFYAIAMMIAWGMWWLWSKYGESKWRSVVMIVLIFSPTVMAVGNWSDHDRSRCHSVRDITLAHLQSCDKGAILFTYADNDTFPLWYLHDVEGVRKDLDLYNVNIIGYSLTKKILLDNYLKRPIYFTHYAYQYYKQFIDSPFRCEGLAWRMVSSEEAAVDKGPMMRHIKDSIRWHITEDEYVDGVSRRLIRVWEENTGKKIEYIK